MLGRFLMVSLGILLAGCAQPPVATVLQTVDVTAPPPAGEGAVAGHIADVELVPVPLVAVALAGHADEAVQTDAAGSFRIDGLEPGAYTLFFQRFGFKSTSREVEVAADNVTALDVVLEVLPIIFPYSHGEHWDGYMSLDFASPAFATRLGTAADQNDRTTFKVRFDDGLATVLSGLTWTASGPASAQRMGVSLYFEAFYATRSEGRNPVVVRLDNWAHRDTADNLTQTVALPVGSMENPVEAATVSYQQRFDLYTTFYYQSKAPQDATPFPS